MRRTFYLIKLIVVIWACRQALDIRGRVPPGQGEMQVSFSHGGRPLDSFGHRCSTAYRNYLSQLDFW